MPAPRLSAADAQSDDDEAPWVPEDSCRQQLDEFWSKDAFGLRKYQVNCHPVEPFSENDPLEARQLLAKVMKPEAGWGIERRRERKTKHGYRPGFKKCRSCSFKVSQKTETLARMLDAGSSRQGAPACAVCESCARRSRRSRGGGR